MVVWWQKCLDPFYQQLKNEFILFQGYSGWGRDQLEDEIENNISKFAYDFKNNFDKKNLKALKKIEKSIERSKKDEKEFLDDLRNQIEDKKRITNKKLE